MTIRIALLSMKEIEKRGQGIPRYIEELYKNLKKLEKIEDIKVEKIYFPRIKFLGDALSFELNSLFYPVKNSFDILHIPTGFFIIHRLPPDAKIISTIHDINPIRPKTKNLNYIIKDKLWRYIALKRGLVWNLRSSSELIANSSQTKEEIDDLGIKGLSINIVNLGIDKRFFVKSKRSHNYENKKFKVGYIGSFATNKNVDFILQTANILNDGVFCLWGAKNYDYEALVEKSKNLKNIEFMGFAPEKKIVRIYDSFDVFTFPSLYEGFGLPILEAQARGLPVIIYKYGKIPKEVRKYCFEAESPEHMAQIIKNLKDNGYNEKPRKKATEYARSFTWEKCARETFEIYTRLCE